MTYLSSTALPAPSLLLRLEDSSLTITGEDTDLQAALRNAYSSMPWCPLFRAAGVFDMCRGLSEVVFLQSPMSAHPRPPAWHSRELPVSERTAAILSVL